MLENVLISVYTHLVILLFDAIWLFHYLRLLVPDSLPRKQGTSELSSKLTYSCVYLIFYPIFSFSNQSYFPRENNQNAPLNRSFRN